MKNKLTLLVACLFTFLTSTMASAPADIFVKPNASGNGTSWATATNLDAALAAAETGDILHLAAGVYVPSIQISNEGTLIAFEEGDKTFEIAKNISLVGGYVSNPSPTDTPDPLNNQAILSGVISPTVNAFHVVTVTAPVEENEKVVLSGLTITGGKALKSTTFFTVNGVNFYRNYGGGIIIGKSVVDMNDCIITKNTSDDYASGMYICSDAKVTANNIQVTENTANTNCGGIWVDASTLSISNSLIEKNGCVGVGAGLYIHSTAISVNGKDANCYLFMYNCTVSGNKTGITGNKSACSGIYGREKSSGHIVNSTIYGNESLGDGGGIDVYGGGNFYVVSSTIFNNSCGDATYQGGGIKVNANSSLYLVNSIVSGNTKLGSSDANDVNVASGGTFQKFASVVGSEAFNASGALISGASFNPSTMLGNLADNGGNLETCILKGDDNPAATYGLSAAELAALGQTSTPQVGAEIMSKDQVGNDRTGTNFMGALAKINTSTKKVLATQSLVAYAINSSTIAVAANIGSKIEIYTLSGQLVVSAIAREGFTTFNQLKQGDMYIVKTSEGVSKIKL